MLDRIHWKEPAEKPPRLLHGKINLTIDVSPEKPGERTHFEQALRILFPGGWTRRDARWFAREAIKAVSRAVIRDQRGFFPLDVVLVWPPELEVGTLKPKQSTVVLVDFRRG